MKQNKMIKLLKRKDIDYTITTDRKVIETSNNIIKILLTHSDIEFELLNKIISIKNIGNFFIIPQKIMHMPKSEITILNFKKFELQNVSSHKIFLKYSIHLFKHLEYISSKIHNLNKYKDTYIKEIEITQKNIKKIDTKLEKLSRPYLNLHKNYKNFSIIFSSFYINNLFYNISLKKYQFTDIDSIKVGKKEFDLFYILANYLKLLKFNKKLFLNNAIFKKLSKNINIKLLLYPLLRPFIDFSTPQFDYISISDNLKTFLIINKISKNILEKEIKYILSTLYKFLITIKN